jgi:Small protein A (tmRNA-binding)
MTRPHGSSTAKAPRRVLLGAAAALAITLAACGTQPRQHGFVMPENALEQVPVGSSEEQVLLVLGTPSTSSTLSGTKAYYYISQAIEENPLRGRRVTDQRVLVVYFDAENNVRQIAEYGLQDGKVFDFISRRTPASGRDLTLLGQILGSSINPGF